MRHVTRAWCSGVGLLLGARMLQASAVASAQAPPPATFASKVELITVDAVVVDAKGKPVEGLTRDDFVVEEDGQRQDIVTFETVSVAPEPEPPAKAAEPPPIATNAVAERKTGRAFAILADDIRLPGEQTLQLRQAMAHFIDTSLGPGDAVVLGTTSGEAWWSARLPEGHEDLRAVLGQVKGRYVDPSTREPMTEYEAYWITHREAGTPPRLDIREVTTGTVGDVSSIFVRVILRFWSKGLCGNQGNHPDVQACGPVVRAAATDLDAARSQRVALTLRAVERALNALAPWPGRTSLILFSPGFLNDDELNRQGVATAALRAHTAVYFVDVRGLLTGFESAAAPGDPLGRENPGRETSKRFEELNLESEGAQALADETGGFSVRNTNDLAAAAERIAAESRTFYLLGFHPSAGKKADAWRKLRVTVRRDGVTTRARRGYRLLPATASGTATSPGPEAPIPLRLASYVLEPVAGNRTRVVAVAEVDISGLGSPAGSEEGRAGLQMRLEAMPRDGGQTQVQDVSLQLASGNTGERSPIASHWRLARLELALSAGVHGVRVFIRDPETGRTGAVAQRIVVPEPADFRLSTPVLSDQVSASRAADVPVSPAPVAHDHFAPKPGRPLLATFEVFGAARDPATGHSSIESRFVLMDGAGRPLAAPPASTLAPSPEGRSQQVIALPPLPGGDYDLSITVRDRLAGNERVVHRTFRVDGPPAPVVEPARSESAPIKPVSGELAAILDRAARYLLAYGQNLSNVLAEEECRQVFRNDDPTKRTVRNTRAGAFFVTLPGPVPWAAFRDVWEVDGNKIRDRAERLGRLFHDAPGSAASRAKAILEESARFNLGPPRTVNIPTLALLFLHPDNQRRFEFELKGRQSFEGTAAVEVAFRERQRPALIAGATAQGAPAKGRIWIDPEGGAVLETDVTYDIDPQDSDHRSQARIVTEYRLEPKLGILVPYRMKETYAWPGVEPPRLHDFRNPQQESTVVTLEANTRYSGYRRFQVTTEESYKKQTEPPD